MQSHIQLLFSDEHAEETEEMKLGPVLKDLAHVVKVKEFKEFPKFRIISINFNYELYIFSESFSAGRYIDFYYQSGHNFGEFKFCTSLEIRFPKGKPKFMKFLFASLKFLSC